MPLVAGVGERIEDVAVTGGPAAVLGRAGPLSGKAARESLALLSRPDRHELDTVLPAVAGLSSEAGLAVRTSVRPDARRAASTSKRRSLPSRSRQIRSSRMRQPETGSRASRCPTTGPKRCPRCSRTIGRTDAGRAATRTATTRARRAIAWVCTHGRSGAMSAWYRALGHHSRSQACPVGEPDKGRADQHGEDIGLHD